MENDPAYLSNLKALPRIDRDGCFRQLECQGDRRAAISGASGFSIVDGPPKEMCGAAGYWIEPQPKRGSDMTDATVSVLLSQDKAGVYYVEHVLKNVRQSAHGRAIHERCAAADARKQSSLHARPRLRWRGRGSEHSAGAGRQHVRFSTASGDKETRAKPISAQAEAGQRQIRAGLVDDEFLCAAGKLPDGRHDDAVDA